MNSLSIKVIKAQKRVYSKVFKVQPRKKPDCERDPEKISKLIFDMIRRDEPCMIARLGSTELSTVVNYIGISQGDKNLWNYINGKGLPWWWDESLIKQMEQWSGFFPAEEKKIEQFCKLTLQDIPKVDMLGSWLAEENYIEDLLPANHKKVWRIFIDPFWASNPWTKALEGKKVLVVHPFDEIIKSQYEERRTELFDNPDMLPEFDLKVLKAVQSLGGDANGFSDWFEALESMKEEIEKIDFDVCLLGCGAYGFPLAAHIKSLGKKAVHWGGSLQLLFGIIGKRWENPEYGKSATKTVAPHVNYPGLIKESWIRPDAYRTKHSANVEGACYW